MILHDDQKVHSIQKNAYKPPSWYVPLKPVKSEALKWQCCEKGYTGYVHKNVRPTFEPIIKPEPKCMESNIHVLYHGNLQPSFLGVITHILRA